MEFTFIIKDNKYSSYKKIAASLLLLNALLFLLGHRLAQRYSDGIVLIGAAIFLAIYALYFWKYKKKKENSFIATYFFASVIWVGFTPSWYCALLYALLAIVQLRVENEISIIVSKEKIQIKSFIPSEFQWPEVSNAVLNGGLLTLDFKNNKILQVEPDWQSPVMNKEYADLEKEFNDFCRQQLSK